MFGLFDDKKNKHSWFDWNDMDKQPGWGSSDGNQDEGVAFIPIPFKQDDAYDLLQDENEPWQDEYDPLHNSDFFDLVPERDYYEDWFDPLCERRYTDFDPLKPIW